MSYSTHKITYAPPAARLLLWHAETPTSSAFKRRLEQQDKMQQFASRDLRYLKDLCRLAPVLCPTPLFTGALRRQRCPAGDASFGAERAVAPRQLPKHGSERRHAASGHASISASRQHQEQKPGGAEVGTAKLFSFGLPCTAIQEALDVSSRNHFISILP